MLKITDEEHLRNTLKLNEQVFKHVKVSCVDSIVTETDIKEEAITSKNWTVIPMDPYCSGFFPELDDSELTYEWIADDKQQRLLQNLLEILCLEDYYTVFVVPDTAALHPINSAFLLPAKKESFTIFWEKKTEISWIDFRIFPESLDFAILLPSYESPYGIIAGSEVFVSSILECDTESAWLNYENYISQTQERCASPILGTAPDGTVYEVSPSDPSSIARNKRCENELRRLKRVIRLYKGTIG
ncbi:MAG: hypothetical protein Q6L68_05510 [Thermostichus sp. DG02_5_bins_236]